MAIFLPRHIALPCAPDRILAWRSILMAPASGTLFTGHDLTCIRGERLVFAGLDFALGAGDALLLVGANGSGKSSLLRLMAGLLRPAAGAVRWSGESIAADPETHNARLHYVGHLDPVKAALTVNENLSFWARMGNGSGTVAGALESFDSASLADVPGRFLSAGQKRRANLARLAASPATLWLLDEPTTALDAAATDCLMAAIARHRADGGMVAISTHAGLALDGARFLDLDTFAGRPDAAGAAP
jgi:heme exporter protein A